MEITVAMEIAAVIAVVVFFSIILLFVGLDRMVHAEKDLLGSRLDQYASRPLTAEEQAAMLAGQPPVVEGLNQMIARGSSQQLAQELARADIKLTPSEYVLINIAAVMIGFLVLLFLTHMNLVLGLVGGIVGFFAPRVYVQQLQARRLKTFNDQLGDMLTLMANSLRSGYSLLQSMETIARDMAPPISVEFSRVVRENGLGLPMDESLQHLLDRIKSDDLDLIITAINIQHEVGGNLAEILDSIAHTIRERVRIKGQIRALTAQQRMSGNLITLLPIVVGLWLFMTNPTYISGLWKDSCGIIMMIVGGLMIVVGYYLIQKVTQIEV